MENSIEKKMDAGMGRRDLLKTGLLLAGSSLLPGIVKASSVNVINDGASGSPAETLTDSDAQIITGRRKLGRTLEVSSIGLGVQNMSRTYQTTIPTRKEMHKIIQKAFDSGVTLFDTAEAYGPFESEKILGEATASFRDKIVIETKFGWNIDPETGKRLPGLNSKPEHIKKVVEAMLKRLRTDRIDLLLQHRVDPEVPIEDVAGAIQDLIKEGKLLHYGLSEPGVQTVRRAHATHPVTAIQNEYSVLWRGPEKTIIPLCEELGIGFVCWSPLGVGFTTGAIDANTRFAQGDIRGGESRFSPENLPKNLVLLEVLKKWGEKKNATPGQISLAWLLHQKPWIVPIPGTTQMAHMQENAAADNVKFTANELQELNAALNDIEIAGERLPAAIQQFSDVEVPLKKVVGMKKILSAIILLTTALTGANMASAQSNQKKYQENTWNLVYHGAITKNEQGQVNIHPVTYKLDGIAIAANVYTPANYDTSKKYPAIVVAHPNGGIKEQTAGLYAQRLAEADYIAITADAAYQGASGGEPRHTDKPASRIEDIHGMADFITKYAGVDADRLGVFGICGGGGYTLKAAQSDKRFKAVATLSMFNSGKVRRNGFHNSALATIQDRLKQATNARAQEVAGGKMIYAGVASITDEEIAKIPTDLYREGYEYYYRTHAHPNSTFLYTMSSMLDLMTWDATTNMDLIDQPLLMMAGSKADTKYMTDEAYGEATHAKSKELFLIDGATHIQSYWKPEYVEQAVNKLTVFFGKNL